MVKSRCMQNGTTDQVDKIVKTLNEGKIASPDVVGMRPDLLSDAFFLGGNDPVHFRHS
jgi:hypothetical protein